MLQDLHIVLLVIEFGKVDKMNKQIHTVLNIEKYNLFVQDFMQHKSLILKSGDAMGTSQWVFYTKEVEKLGILPPGW